MRHPWFARSLPRFRVVDLGPGDSLFLPEGWWHHVDSSPGQEDEPLVAAVNFWWQSDTTQVQTDRLSVHVSGSHVALQCTPGGSCRLPGAPAAPALTAINLRPSLLQLLRSGLDSYLARRSLASLQAREVQCRIDSIEPLPELQRAGSSTEQDVISKATGKRLLALSAP